MWIKYIGEKKYSSLEVRDFKPKERRDVDAPVAKHLLEKYPEWFKICKAPVKKALDVVKEVPKIIKGVLEKKEEEKDDIDIEEVKKK